MQRRQRLSADVSASLSFYIHIPYCIKRCGYCDFNTYTPKELQGTDVSSVSSRYIDAALAEIEMAATTIGGAKVPTIFFGGGTPSLMPAHDLSRVISAIKNRFELAHDAEITIEVNPDSVSQEFLDQMKAAGATRISMGMQSAVPHVLAALDRTHLPENVARSVSMVKAAGYEHCSVDLIYGTPGESIEDWRLSVDTALALEIDHVSAYALIVEKGTRLAQQIKSGEMTLPPDDETAEKYQIIDKACQDADLHWYELSNWARKGGECRHNIAYWNGSSWWGIGPGAHSYLAGKRWWNVKHPATYQSLISENKSPESESETLSNENKRDEYIMLNIRMRTGIVRDTLNENQQQIAQDFLDTGHVDQSLWSQGRLVLTQSGRLIADRIVRELLV
jgi:putative oxygen-independent coproporphyrinogen III oxidase